MPGLGREQPAMYLLVCLEKHIANMMAHVYLLPTSFLLPLIRQPPEPFRHVFSLHPEPNPALNEKA